MTRKFRITTFLSVIAIFFVSILLSLSLFVKPAKADASSVFEMEYGAGVKLNETNGLRFKAKMSQDYYDQIVTNDPDDKVKLVGYIAPVEEFDKVAEYKDLGVKVGGNLDESKIYQEDGFYHANIAITGLDAYVDRDGIALYHTSFSAIMFIVDNTSDSPVYTYADLAKDANGEGVGAIENQTRTQYQIVNAAALDTKESYESKLQATYGEWHGVAEDAPIMLSTTAEYDAFVAKLAADATYADGVEGKTVFLKKAVSEAVNSYAEDKKIAKYVNVTEEIGHVVTFYDGYRLVKLDFVADGETATAPAEPTRTDGYDFQAWIGGDIDNPITKDETVYAKWAASKGEIKDIGNLTVYGVTLSSGGQIAADDDVIGQKVTLASGDLGHGAYYPNEGETNDPTDENNTADQAYLAYDGQYGFNDYFVADFTGKNMPTMAF
ncbi:MAG: hypothetical protein E7377_06030, partial [Clostridiales bacterium]|nr:hypothetical protein [Clostridiales bacterium]